MDQDEMARPPVGITDEEVALARPAARPTGGGQLMTAYILMGLGAAVFGLALFMPATTHPYGLSSLPAEPNAAKLPMFWGGVALLNLGLVLWLVGSILRAIFFLPGRVLTKGELSLGEALAAEAVATKP